jgi:UDP-2,3-diacylglucosamine pyrophosphatase LpxH
MSLSQTMLAAEKIPYGEKRIRISSGDKEIFVISDLHMAAGLNANGNYDGTENFFADKSLSRFLDHIRRLIPENRKGLLIINGDFVDFLRIRNIPRTSQEFISWEEILSQLGIDRSSSDLEKSINKKEIKYGLGTEDYKSVWKLHICANGHRLVFESLATWLMNGHELIITKGNHDLEWFWRPVRDFLRMRFAESLSARMDRSAKDLLENIVAPQVHFADDSLVIDDKIYIEHGHRYENFTTVDGPPLLGNGTQLNLPFGSFFNRYLINRVELAYPYIDDVRPRQNILPVLIRERFPLAVQLLFNYIPFTLLIIPKKQYGYALRYLFHFLLIIVLPLAITVFALYKGFPHGIHLQSSSSQPIWQGIFSELKNLLLLVLSYVFGRLLAWWQLSSPTSLYPNAQHIMDQDPSIQLVTFGHTHDPEQKTSDSPSGRYLNTGTWIPVYEIDASDVRLDRTYTFIHLEKDESGNIKPADLLRWNDDAMRDDPLILMDIK